MSTWNRWIVEWLQAILESFSGANKIIRRLLFPKKVCPLPGMCA